MEEHQSPLLPLLMVAVLAFVVPLVLKRVRSLRIPITVGEILAGMAVGRSGLNLIHVDTTLQLLNFLGLAALMFLSGLEIDFDRLLGKRKPGAPASWRERLYHPLGIGTLSLALTFGGAWFVAAWLEQEGFVRSAPLLALIISTAALSLTVPVLKEAQMLQSRFGQTLLTASVLGDFLPMVALTVGVSLYAGGFSVQTLLILGLLAAVLVVYRLGRAMLKYNLLSGLWGGTAQIGVRASFAVMLVFVALAESLGAEVVLGAFLAGALMSLLSGSAREEVSHKLDALGFGFLIPVFFLVVGINFDFRVLFADPQAVLFVPVLLGVTLLVRSVPPSLLLLPFHGLRPALAGGALLAAQMSVTIAAASVVKRSGAISESIHAAIILTVIILAVLGPVLFGRLMPAATPAEQPLVLVAGANPRALRLAERLQPTDPVQLIDADPAKVEAAGRKGLAAAQGDMTRPECLRQAVGDRQVRAVVAMTGNDDTNLQVARLAREVLGVKQAYALVADAARWESAQAQGLQAVNPDLATVSLLENLLHNPGAAALLQNGSDDVGLFDVVLVNPRFVGRRLRDVRLPADVLIAAIHRNGHKLIPHGDTELAAGDVLTIVGDRDQREQVHRQLSY